MQCSISNPIITAAFIVFTLLAGSAIAQDETRYVVMTGAEGLHAIWPADKEVPRGWTATEMQGTEQECLDHIEEVWTDMRPLSMQKKYRKKMKDGYVVIVNHEEQYMIWPREEYVPDDWDLAGAGGSYDDCLNHIREVWTDMRPLSLRGRMRE